MAQRALHAFYRLVDGTVEIDGVKMHQVRSSSPQAAARAMVAQLRLKPGMRVLDVCTGLGYTAIEEAKKGCSVVTVDIDGRVVELSKENPASKELFGNSQIRRFLGDAVPFVAGLEDESFDAVLHDPPRFSFAGELYSGEFYRQLFRVLLPGGRIFHYTGKPGEARGVRFRKGIVARLRDAGFEKIEWVEAGQGYSAVKLRR